jgi:chromosome segregation ATPase
MGVLGKILVFINLVFSLLTAGLIIVVFTTRENWRQAYQKAEANMRVVQAAAQADVAAADQRVLEKDKLHQALDREKKAAEAAKAKTEEELKKAKDDLVAFQNIHEKNTTNVDATTQELNRRKTEVEALQKLLAEREQKITDIDLQMATLRDQKVQFEVQYKAAKEKLNSLMTQNEALVKENGQLKAQLGNIQTLPSTVTKTVPPEDARGTVKTVQNELATITIGTDAGINVGNVLQVYRVRPQPEYLGTLTILAATPHEAVGRLSGAKRSQVRVGDEVAARVLPN